MPNRHRRTVVLGAAAALALLVACGEESAPPGSGGGSGSDTPSLTPDPAQPSIDADTELVGFATVLGQDGEPIEFCLGGVLESYPPQCGGPQIVGLEWADLEGLTEVESSGGVTWASATLAGTYDREADTFTVTRPVAETIDLDLSGLYPEAEYDFPRVCEDPYEGVDADWADGSGNAQNELGEFLENYEPVVASWVSDGAHEFNVLVQAGGDPDAAIDAAYAELRAIWPGPLCVDAVDAPSQQDRRAAQEAIFQSVDGVLFSDDGGADYRVNVGVIVADGATLDAVYEAGAPWVTPEQIHVSGQLQPFAELETETETETD